MNQLYNAISHVFLCYIANVFYFRALDKKFSNERKKRPWWDSNPQSPAPEADALSIRPQGQVAKTDHL